MIRVCVFACDCGEKCLHFKTNVNIANIQVSNSNQLKGMKALHSRDCCALSLAAMLSSCESASKLCITGAGHGLRAWRSFRTAGALLVCFCHLCMVNQRLSGCSQIRFTQLLSLGDLLPFSLACFPTLIFYSEPLSEWVSCHLEG